MNASSRSLIVVLGCLWLGACSETPIRTAATEAIPVDRIRVTSHHNGDDLLTAGLGADGLRSASAPVFADLAHPTTAELRRRAIWSNWRGIADLTPGGGYGEFYGSLQPVPGREYHALRTVPGASQPHRVMLQLPDGFDPASRCVVVTASSGSRGIYGAIALAGAWGLPRGCAVAYTDKGAGTDYFDVDSGTGVLLDGSRSAAGELAFAPKPQADAAPSKVLIKHAHSGDNPEADWGRHVKQAAEFALQTLDSAYPLLAPFTFANTRMIAVGVSNGGGSVLRASEDEQPWLDGVVAISPNISAEGGRPLFDYGSEAGLLMPCALAAPEFAAAPFAGIAALAPAAREARCASLYAADVLHADNPAAQTQEALTMLRAHGWHDAALMSAALTTAFDLWHAVGSTYAAAYARTGSAAMPCGSYFAALGNDGQPRATNAAERDAWWADGSGIPPGAGVMLLNNMAVAGSADSGFAALQCLRRLWDGQGEYAARLIEGVQATRAGLPRAGLPVIVIHGNDDGLIPEPFSARPWVSAAQANQRNVRYWRVAHAQHFDAFLSFPQMASRYVPLMPYAYRALDRMWAHLHDGAPLPADTLIQPNVRSINGTSVAPLREEDLALPQ